ncbi:hypothetical protein OPU71_02695 [Niveibacterium sp. 24ML]|uniref:hypothetical protein n=1 Tax=Niveibacterium sp. 24ML TaxID=2985512 RepID=UPI0022708951|nr:hypothetical protein [Niveibacterium sp. 24ML]MCX9155030.1 hypothetical protein [Niveibacterium sp. 24ML]
MWGEIAEYLATHPGAWLLLRATLASGLMWLAWRLGGPFGLVIALVPAVTLIVVPFTHASFGLLRWARKRHLKPWDGRWYEFDGRQIRIFEQADHSWICAEDVFAVFGEVSDKVTHERYRTRFGALGYREPAGESLVCFSEAALRRYLSLRSDDTARRFARWLGQTLFAHEKRRREAPFK